MTLERLTPEIGPVPQFPVKTIPVPDWRDGLILRTPNWLGDAVMAIPAMIQLKKIVPASCGLFVVCPKGIAPLFEAMPEIVDRVIVLRDPHAFPSREEFSRVRWALAGIGILFNNSFRDALWFKCARIPKLYGASARFRSFLLERSFSFPPRLDHVLNKPHQAAKYLSIAMALGAEEWDGTLPDFAIPYEPELYSDTLRSALECDNLLAIAPGAAYGDAKRWHAEGFREAALWWIREKGGRIALLSAPNEADSARRVLEGLPEESVFDLAGKTSLNALMLLLKKARFCVANDSGTMHLAAVLGAPGVVPFGPTDPAATSPLSSRWRILYDKQSCAPCFKRECPDGTKKCLESIRGTDMIEAMKSLEKI